MKKTLCFLSMLLLSTAAYAEAGKGIKFTFGELLVIFLVIILIAVICQFVISGIVYVLLNAIAAPRKKIWGTFWGGFLGALLVVLGGNVLPNHSLVIDLVSSSIIGSVIGFLVSSKKLKSAADTPAD